MSAPMSRVTEIAGKLRNVLSHLNKMNFIPQILKNNGINQLQKRTKYMDMRMYKDNKKRKVFEEFGPERLRINAMRTNTVLPREIQEMAQKQISELPLDSCHTRLHKRCILSSRPRGNLRRWRMSRIMFRKLADYNKLSGVTRGVW